MDSHSIPPGFVGNLSSEQEDRLQQLWALMLQFGEAPSILDPISPVSSSTETQPKAPSPSLRSRNSFLYRTESNISRRNSTLAYPAQHARLLDSLRAGGMATSEIRAARKCLASLTPDEVRFGIVTAAKQEPPDAYLLRFLRFAKWDVNKAFVRLLNSLRWRMKEMNVDSQLLAKGELHALQLSQRALDREAAEEGEAFLDQLRMGKSYVHGVDKMNRPVCVIRVRLHQPGAQSETVLNQFITHMMESVRLLITPPQETGVWIRSSKQFFNAVLTWVIDSYIRHDGLLSCQHGEHSHDRVYNSPLTGQEYAAVKFIIRCFETYYPELLGVMLLHNAPKIFSSEAVPFPGSCKLLISTRYLESHQGLDRP